MREDPVVEGNSYMLSKLFGYIEQHLLRRL
jgi:hypothetical protein